MVKINSPKVLTIPIPSIDGSEVTLKESLTAGEFEQVSVLDSPLELMPKALSFMIQKWNLEGEDGKSLPVDLKNIKKLDMFDVKALFEATDFGKKSIELTEKKMN